MEFTFNYGRLRTASTPHEKKVILMNVTDNPRRGYRTIRLPIQESEYSRFENDVVFARKEIDQLYNKYPELFPDTFVEGCVFNGKNNPFSQAEIPIQANTTQSR